MASIGTPAIRRMIDVAHPRHDRNELLASVGLASEEASVEWAGESVDEATYYTLLERIADDDPEFPLRYAQALQPDDLGALGLAFKTAPTVEAALERLVRYVVVLSDTLAYEFTDVAEGRSFELVGRPHHRRGVALANECALAAVTSILRRITGTRVTPSMVEFRHHAPADGEHHRSYFGCPVRFDSYSNSLRLSEAQLARRTLLGDDGLSTYLLARLDDLTTHKVGRSIVDDVRAAVADALPDGQPSKTQVARRLGVSERTLHRHLADHHETFQAIATRARRDAAESLLTTSHHSIVEIAFLTGFSDQTAFSRAFKRWTGTTPAAFRSEDAGAAR